jgi:hypothetical protein
MHEWAAWQRAQVSGVCRESISPAMNDQEFNRHVRKFWGDTEPPLRARRSISFRLIHWSTRPK